MDVKQVYALVNDATREALGESVILNEDLSNVVDVGNAIFNNQAKDSYVRALLNRVGKTIFVSRKYQGIAPSVLMDAWEFGSVLSKQSMKLPQAEENESWELVDGATYEVNLFTKPQVDETFFNSKLTFEIPISICERQVKQSFNSPMELNGFVSMIYNTLDNAMTLKIDELIQRVINVAIAETIQDDYQGASTSATSGVKAVNLLKLYNDAKGTTLTKAQCITDKEFIRFATYTMGLYLRRMNVMSTLFNVDGRERFTPKDLLKVVLLDEFDKASKVYLESDTYHKELVSLGENYSVVPYWQGSGTTYAFADVSKIDVKMPSGATLSQDGILGVMFDRDAIAVCNTDRRTTTNYNAKGEFYNNWYKFDTSLFYSKSENVVVFFVA